MSQASVNRGVFWKVILGGLVVVGVISVCCRLFHWCPWFPPMRCPECPDCCNDEFAAELIVDDVHGAPWMVFDNDWVSDDLGSEEHDVCALSDDPKDYLGDCKDDGYETEDFRHGLMIQLGELVDEDHRDVLFSQVVLRFENGSDVHLGGGIAGNPPFDWLDINPADRSCSIDAFHAYSLFKSGIVTVECDGATVNPASKPSTCLRDRSLHSSFDPTIGVVTYWSGPSYYEMTAHLDNLGGGHVGYTFRLSDPVTVDRWDKGCFQTRYEDVVEILIDLVDPDSNHTIFHDDPSDGGAIGRT